MTLVFESDHLALLALLNELREPEQHPYLVGGAVRDAILGQTLHDMDFVMGENPTRLAKKLAKRLQAGFFVLDDERHTARVVYHDPHGRHFPLDFVQFIGRDLEEDLRNRDFTINAMAVHVNDLHHVIDPLDGQADLRNRLLRACSDHALLDDPVRVLRGVRLAVQFDLHFGSGLEKAMQGAARLLPKTSNERQRDEFFRLLGGPDPASGLRLYRRIRLFDTLVPKLGALDLVTASPEQQQTMLEHAINTVQQYHRLLEVLTNRAVPEDPDHPHMQNLLSVLGKFSNQIEAFFTEELTPGRSKATLALLGALLCEVGASQELLQERDPVRARKSADLAFEISKNFPLSNAESNWVKTMVQHQLHLNPLITACKIPERRMIFRFFQLTGEVGIAVALLTLAEILADEGRELEPNRWQCALLVAEACLAAWWENHEGLVAPQPLLDGHALQHEFGLEPGKNLGRLLGQLVEEQASGTIANRDEARDFINKKLSELSEMRGKHENQG